MKKLTAILLSLMLIIAITPSAFATVYTEMYFHYTIADESITIIGYFGDEETVTVPAMIAGIPVNTIATGAFTDSGIKVLNLPDTITEIRGDAIDAGVVINYNSNLPQGGQTTPPQPEVTQPYYPQTTPTQPYYPQPPMPGIVIIPPTTQSSAPDDTTPDDIFVPEDDVPDDIAVTEEVEVDIDIDELEQPPQREPQSTKPASQQDESKPQSTQTAKPEQPAVTTAKPGQPAVTTSTESTNPAGENDAVPDTVKTEAVTIVPTEDVTVSTEETQVTEATRETQAASEAAAEPERDEKSSPLPVVAVIAASVVAAALVRVGYDLWKKKK